MSDTQHVSVAIAQFVVPHAIFDVSPPGPASGGSIPPSPPSATLELPPSLFPLVPELDVVPDEDVAPDDEVPPLGDEAPASAGAAMSLLGEGATVMLEGVHDARADIGEILEAGREMWVLLSQRRETRCPTRTASGSRVDRAAKLRWTRGAFFTKRPPTRAAALDEKVGAHTIPDRMMAVTEPMRSVLVVEDDPLIRDLVRRMLAPSFDVTTVAGCGEALRLLGNGWRFDVLLLDLHLRDGHAVAVFERFCALDAGAERRVVVMTGGAFTKADDDFLARVRDALVLSKPFSKVDLLRFLRIAGARSPVANHRAEALPTASSSRHVA